MVTARMVAFGEYEDDDTASALKARDFKDATDLVAHSLRTGYGDRAGPLDADGFSQAVYAIQERAVSENPAAGPDGAGFRDDGQAYTLESRRVPQAIAVTAKDHGGDASEDVSPTLQPGGGHSDSHANGGVMPAIAFTEQSLKADGSVPTLVSGEKGGGRNAINMPHTPDQFGVRRLTPRECERLQGFPDDYTRIPWEGWRDMDAAEDPDQCREEGMEARRMKSGKWRVKDVDGPRYKALGNSMAVPVMRWVGERIQAVEDLRLNDWRPPESAAA